MGEYRNQLPSKIHILTCPSQLYIITTISVVVIRMATRSYDYEMEAFGEEAI